MAYFNQEMKKELAPGIKAVLAKYNCKGSISVKNHSTLKVTVKSGPIDFIGHANNKRRDAQLAAGREFYPVETYYQENPYREYVSHDPDKPLHISEQFVNEMQAAMKGTLYYNNSDIMTDYFDYAYFMSIDIGAWDKPYKLIA